MTIQTEMEQAAHGQPLLLLPHAEMITMREGGKWLYKQSRNRRTHGRLLLLLLHAELMTMRNGAHDKTNGAETGHPAALLASEGPHVSLPSAILPTPH